MEFNNLYENEKKENFYINVSNYINNEKMINSKYWQKFDLFAIIFYFISIFNLAMFSKVIYIIFFNFSIIFSISLKNLFISPKKILIIPTIILNQFILKTSLLFCVRILL